NDKADKFAARSRKCIFVGYPYGKKGWRVYDMELEVFVVSRNVVFNKDEFPYQATSLEEPVLASLTIKAIPMIEEDTNGQSGTTIDQLLEPPNNNIPMAARDENVRSEKSYQVNVEVVDASAVEPDAVNVQVRGGSNDNSSSECLGKANA
ncbi:hypothetical protein L195_g050359, partial [Trifolium pratense]